MKMNINYEIKDKQMSILEEQIDDLLEFVDQINIQIELKCAEKELLRKELEEIFPNYKTEYEKEISRYASMKGHINEIDIPF